MVRFDVDRPTRLLCRHSYLCDLFKERNGGKTNGPTNKRWIPTSTKIRVEITNGWVHKLKKNIRKFKSASGKPQNFPGIWQSKRGGVGKFIALGSAYNTGKSGFWGCGFSCRKICRYLIQRSSLAFFLEKIQHILPRATKSLSKLQGYKNTGFIIKSLEVENWGGGEGKSFHKCFFHER